MDIMKKGHLCHCHTKGLLMKLITASLHFISLHLVEPLLPSGVEVL
jgi:hypothetical protein